MSYLITFYDWSFLMIFITFSFGFMIKECKCKVFIFFKKGCFVPNTVSGLFVKKMYQ